MAASITAEEARHVAFLPKEKGKLQLLSCLGWEPLNEEIDTRETIHLDYLYDNLMFAVGKGFSWSQVCSVLSAAEELLVKTKGKSLVEAVKFYQELSLSLIQALGERNFQIYTEFVFSTFMTHFKLFQYVLNFDREKLFPKVSRRVECPPIPGNLGEAKLDHIWRYEQEYNSIECKEKERTESWSLEQQNVAKQSALSKASLKDKLQNTEVPLTKESVSQIIKDILSTSATTTTEHLKTMISQTMDELQYKLERTVLPRPQAMGPPPRFNPTAVTPPQAAEVIPPVPVDQVKSIPKGERQRPRSSRSAKSNKSGKS